jgi:hypothetical protein
MKPIAVIAAVVCLIAGFAAGFAFANARATANVNADRDEVRFARSIGEISASTNTLMLIDQRRADQIQQLHEKMLAQFARDARETVHSARHIGGRAAGIDQSLAFAAAYAQRRGMKDTVADLSAVRDAIRSMASGR